MKDSFSAHPTAIIDSGAEIGAGSKIWHWVHVCGQAVIGQNCVLGQNVFVGNDVKVGDGVKIQNNVSVYDGVRLENDVFCGPSMVFTNVYNPRAGVEKKSEFRKTIVRTGATLGANCTVICGATIGSFAMVGAGAVVREDVKPYALMVGVPARQIGWVDFFGERLPFPVSGHATHRCSRNGDYYALDADQVTRTSDSDQEPK